MDAYSIKRAAFDSKIRPLLINVQKHEVLALVPTDHVRPYRILARGRDPQQQHDTFQQQRG